MDLIRRLVFVNLFIHLLMMLSVAHQQSGAKEMDSIQKETNILQLHSMDFHDHQTPDRKGFHVDQHHVHIHSSSHTDGNNMHPSLHAFFHFDDLKIGKKILIYFPDRVLSSHNFLPKKEADVIPFSSEELQHILQFLSLPQGSPEATAMEGTLRACEMEPIEGETKLCATSIASVLDFVQDILGGRLDNKIKVLSTIHHTRLTSTLQNYTITEVPEEILVPKMVACHILPYPYGVLYCHYQMGSRAYRVPLLGEHGDKVEAVAVCHLDTSHWSRNHLSFLALGIEPGQPVCHFFAADNLLFIPSTTST